VVITAEKGSQSTVRIEKATGIGFCFGVRRAIDILEKLAAERSQIETLGAVVHNQQVVQKLAGIGIRVADSLKDITGDVVAIGTHGTTPQVEEELRTRFTEVINTTCPFVHRAQTAARKLARSGFSVVIYGDANHPEVKGILGWADGKGIATLDEGFLSELELKPRRLGILSQTTQVPSNFTQFAKQAVDSALTKDAEIRIIDTICHDIRGRQQAALELASKVDLMLVIGSHTSANTNRLAELCATTTKTLLIETADEIQPAMLEWCSHIGIPIGASTSGQTIDEVLSRLEELAP
jgi:4-hydroxy-3-methylbut-2-enyl diphosphate reductase